MHKDELMTNPRLRLLTKPVWRQYEFEIHLLRFTTRFGGMTAPQEPPRVPSAPGDA
jgi:hypothetical protein